jgi:DNA-binding transcriptional MerR regulator
LQCEPDNTLTTGRKVRIVTWSTRELAELAGTTVNTVRYYHALGLLEVPERKYNGYKQYQVRHLVRLIQVRRLADLGVPLALVSTVADEGAVSGGLQRLRAEVEAQLERLTQARSDIAAILEDGAPADTPRGFEPLASQLSDADRALIHIYTRLHDRESLSALKMMVAAESGAVRLGFDALREETGDADRQLLAHRIAEAGANWRSADRPWLDDSAESPRRAQITRQTIVDVLRGLYNPVQLDVLDRAEHVAARGRIAVPLVTEAGAALESVA